MKVLRPYRLAPYYLLLFSFIFLALGGVVMPVDPSSGHLAMPTSILANSSVHGYFLLGLWILFVMGISPIFPTHALLKHPGWKWAIQYITGINAVLVRVAVVLPPSMRPYRTD